MHAWRVVSRQWFVFLAKNNEVRNLNKLRRIEERTSTTTLTSHFETNLASQTKAGVLLYHQQGVRITLPTLKNSQPRCNEHPMFKFGVSTALIDRMLSRMSCFYRHLTL